MLWSIYFGDSGSLTALEILYLRDRHFVKTVQAIDYNIAAPSMRRVIVPMLEMDMRHDWRQSMIMISRHAMRIQDESNAHGGSKRLEALMPKAYSDKELTDALRAAFGAFGIDFEVLQIAGGSRNRDMFDKLMSWQGDRGTVHI
jgi:hypothetical protein